jgi:hypothetical protein
MDSDFLGRPTQQWMVNFRVRDLGAMVSQLRGADVAVEVDPELYPNGRFARLADPDGIRFRSGRQADANTA